MSGVDDLLEVHQVSDVNQAPLAQQQSNEQQDRVLQQIESSSCLFSSGFIPESKNDMKNFKSIPFGLLFSPFVNDNEVLRKTPAKCSQCKAYIHCYCTITSDHNNIKWNCTFCGQENSFYSSNEISQFGNYQRDQFPELIQTQVDFIDPVEQPMIRKLNSPVYIFLIDGNITKVDMEVRRKLKL